MRYFSVFVIAAFAVPAPAIAQNWSMMSTVNNMVQNDSTRSQNNNMNKDIVEQERQRDAGANYDETALNYRVDANIRQRNVSNYVSNMRQSGDERGAAALEAIGPALVGQVDQSMRQVGLRADNLADAFAYWWVTQWQGVSGREVQYSARLFGAVKRQASNVVLAAPDVAASSDAVKQETAEMLIIQAAITRAHIDKVNGDSAQKAALAEAINRDAKAMGMDLTRIELTDEGFVPR